MDYSEINGKVELDVSFGDYMDEELEFASKVELREVQSPFILPDNYFDLREANNTTEVFNVREVEQVSFTGGSLYTIYEKTGEDAYIIHGNGEEGYNIFKLV